MDEGKRVKSALIRKIGGKKVRVTVEGVDRYGRILGVVTCEDEDIGKWLVEKGYAVAAYGNRYVAEEAAARKSRRGRWSYAKVCDPYEWRQGKTELQNGKPVRQENSESTGKKTAGTGMQEKGSGSGLVFGTVVVIVIIVVVLAGF